MFTYKTQGTCSSQINIEVDGDTVKHVEFVDGCPGNTRAVSRLAEGRKIDELIQLLEGTPCRGASSCPDQLAQALKKIKEMA